MKNYFICLIIISAFLIIGCRKSENVAGNDLTQGKWKLVHSAQNSGHFSAIFFSDQNNGWAIGDTGRILRTNDGGDSWSVQESGTNASLKCIFFANKQKGWIGGGNNSIGTTTDGGASWDWQSLSVDSRKTFMAMSFVDENTGWLTDNFGGIIHTENGGVTWTPQTSNTEWAITSLQFLDRNEGWAVATNKVVLHTTNGGSGWNKTVLDSIYYNGAAVFEDIFFYNRSNGWIASNAMVSEIANPRLPLMRTSDSGKTWTSHLMPEQTLWIASLQFISERVGWAAGTRAILHTTDGGETWIYEFENSAGIFVDICFVDELHGWAITFTGDIYKYLR